MSSLGLLELHPRLRLPSLRSVLSFLAIVFLLSNLTARAFALHAGGEGWSAFVIAVPLTAALCLLRPALLAPTLFLFGGSFFLYGFHSYRLQNQAFEYVVTALALVFWLGRERLPRPASAPAPAYTWIVGLWVLYALLALFSLLLLPPGILSDRFFLEGGDVVRAVLGAFPSDPLYPIAGVNRLVLFVLFTARLSRHPEARHFYRMLFRGIAAAVILAVVLGLLDFLGVISLAGYNLSHLFYGAGYRRLQSTFGNPGWYACFVSCALPLVLLKLWEGSRRYRLALAVFFPLCAAGLILAAARAAWVATVMVLAALLVLIAFTRRGPAPVPPLGRPGWLALGATAAVVIVLVVAVYAPWGRALKGEALATGRLEGLAREMQIRGLSASSPRSVAAAYALALAREGPFLGLGYETFNLHLRAQLAVPGSTVARVVNTAIGADPGDTFFDDAHDTYLQVLVGTGGLGLTLWLALGAAGLYFVGLELRHEGTPTSLCVFLTMLVFHLYGLFQGMQYIVVTWFVFHLAAGYAMTVQGSALPLGMQRALRGAFLLLGALVLLSAFGYRADQGFRDLKKRYALEAYLPEEAAEFEGFYRPETGPQGEFRWMARRGIINVKRSTPFHLLITCEHPDLEREPVRLDFRFDGNSAGSIVFRHAGQVEERFDFGRLGVLRLSVSRTWRPEGQDQRELGVAISAIRWE